VNGSCHTCERVLSRTWTCSITHMNKTCRTCKRVMSHAHMNESCHTYERVMSHSWMRGDTHINESYYTYMNITCIWMTRVTCIWMRHICISTNRVAQMSLLQKSPVKEIYEHYMYMNDSSYVYMNETHMYMNESRRTNVSLAKEPCKREYILQKPPIYEWNTYVYERIASHKCLFCKRAL